MAVLAGGGLGELASLLGGLSHEDDDAVSRLLFRPLLVNAGFISLDMGEIIEDDDDEDEKHSGDDERTWLLRCLGDSVIWRVSEQAAALVELLVESELSSGLGDGLLLFGYSWSVWCKGDEGLSDSFVICAALLLTNWLFIFPLLVFVFKSLFGLF